MKVRFLSALLFFILPLMSSAQNTLTTSGDYTFYAPTNITLDQAKLIALERAKTQIIADNFGTIVGVNNSTVVSNTNGTSSVSFLSLGESEVKGEWLETIGEPRYDVTIDQNMLVVKVHIKGKIRELKTAKIQFESHILRNGTDDKFESDSFKDGDNLYLSFLCPVDGYLAVYLYDQTGVSRLLPLKGQKEGSVAVKGGERMVFFERKLNVFAGYELTCSLEQEMNRIYVIFSPNKFIRPNDTVTADNMPASLSFEAFQKWLAKCRHQDLEMSVKITDIMIRER